MSDRPEDHGLSGGEPPMAPPPPPSPAGAVDLESSTPVRSRGIGGRVAAGALGVALLLGGVAFAATQVGSDGGASDPEAAVEEMFEAIAAEDVLGVLATLDPAERDAISRPVERLFAELERLDVLDESFDLAGVAGVDLEFEGLELEAREIRDDLYRVHLMGGTASYSVNTDQIPVGEFLTDTFERFGVEYRGIQESDSEALDPDATGDVFVVVRDTGDGWHVSLGYTAVEAARLDMGAPVPAGGAGLKAIGAASPEEAVEGFLEALVAVDIEGAVARLSPGELGAVHDYWRVLVADADLPTAADVPADIELTDLELRSTEDGDRGQVFIDSIGLDVVTEDFEGGGTIARGCIEVRGDIRPTLEEEGFDLPEGPICQEDIEEILEEVTGEAGLGLSPLGGLDALTLGNGDTPDLGIAVVHFDDTDRIEGGWFVAPLGTWTDLGLAMLETLERKDLDAMVDAVEGFFGGFSEAVGGGFMPPGMEDDFEEFEDFGDVEASTEVFSDVGDPIYGDPGTAGSVDTATEGVLIEMLGAITGDPAVADCALDELYATARIDQLYEIAESYEYDYEPSAETQDVFFAALTACGG